MMIIDDVTDDEFEEWKHMSDALALLFSGGANKGPSREKGDNLADRLLKEFYGYRKPDDKL